NRGPRPTGSSATRRGRLTTVFKIRFEEAHDDVPRRAVEISQAAQEVLVATHHRDDAGVGRDIGARSRLGGGAVHLHAVLRWRCASSACRPITTIAPRRWCPTGGRRRSR